MPLPQARERPMSVATIATVQSEAPPPYSEYDDTAIPAPNAQTQAMLRGGYIARNQRDATPSLREYGPATAYMRGRPYTTRHENTITIARAIHPGIKADGIPFPSEYPAVSSRDVSADDWSYFISCVLRELEVPNVKGAVATPVTMNEFRERQDMVDATIDQWNRGFFTPRGIHIVPAYSFYRNTGSAPETVRSSSPTPTYRTALTASQDDEIMTITIDTSPRSSRAGTPDTIRELNEGEKTPPGVLTPKTVDEEFLAPPEQYQEPQPAREQPAREQPFREQPLPSPNAKETAAAAAEASPEHATRPRQNSIPRKPVLPKRPSLTGPHLTPEHANYVPQKSKPLRKGSFSDSDSSISSFDSFSSDDELAYGDVPEIRRTLADEFNRDPKNWSHLKTALAQIRNDVRQQHRATVGATKQQQASIRAAAKEHRKQMHGEMKELRKEMHGYYKEHRNARKDAMKHKKEMAKEWKHERREAKKEKHRLRKEGRNTDRADRAERRDERRDERADRRQGRNRTPVHAGGAAAAAGAAAVAGAAAAPGRRPWDQPLMGGSSSPGYHMSMPQPGRGGFGGPGFNASMPHLAVAGPSPPGTRVEAGPGMPGRAMSSVSFDGTGASPSCVRSRSPRPGTAGSANYGMPNLPGLQTLQNIRDAHLGHDSPAARFLGGRRQGPIGMARDFLMAQANAGIERLRMDGADGPAPRAAPGDDKRWPGREQNGQETGVVRR